MSFSLGTICGQPQEFELRAGFVYINGEVQPFKGVGFEEVVKAEESIAAITGDDEGSCALRDAARIRFILYLLSHAVGDDTLGYLEHLLGVLQFRVEKYLGETDPDAEFEEVPYVPRRTDDEDAHHHHHHHHHDHEHGDCCCHDHHDGDDGECSCHSH